ncbi:hypothetical protein PROSTU_01000 [Providencia stuartii ATCC 25827]|uniref:Uncharacterized protein n=1 Tax=Providencia stuartii ATCC 25827 TaxID=471874 RepID=A0AA87CSB1_PROST|nr:hypothetical protein PROSTU_01000 [Providencia stuartii ATCC 25827]
MQQLTASFYLFTLFCKFAIEKWFVRRQKFNLTIFVWIIDNRQIVLRK